MAVPLERAVFMREQDSRMYGVGTYYVTKALRCDIHAACAALAGTATRTRTAG